MKYKEYELDESTFMGAWYMPEDICDDIIDTFKKNKHMWSKGAVLETAEEKGVGQSDTKIKDSFDIGILAKESWYPFNVYKQHLNEIFKLYEIIIYNIIHQVVVLKSGILKEQMQYQ